MKLIRFAAVPALLLWSGACASTAPSAELVDARKTYAEAAQAGYDHTVPAHMYEARQKLAAAERAHEEDPGSESARHQAYLAEREAEFAIEQGQLYQARRMLATARSEHERVQLALQERTEAKLEQAEERSGQLEDAAQRLSERQRELQEQLARAETETERAELRAQAALASLHEVALVKEEANEWIITLSGAVLFATAKHELLPIAREKLDQVAQALKEQDESRQIVVEGHSDSRGSDQFNQKLSLDRANSVREYLVSQGVDPNRIVAVGKGETRPLATNDSPEGRANNRRVEIRVRDAGKQAPQP